ncbi:MAG TPA: 3-dehydroquinate synthase [Candidatus Dormibacteraeota bacterium]|nr:3-dehydroquinate synthase [Candidatus Dormibacteraeota bacterium]
MAQLTVQSSSHDYNIYIDDHIRYQLKQYLKKDYSSIMIVTDENVAKLYLNDIKKNFTNEQVFQVIIPNGEQSKDIDHYYKLQTEAIQNGLDRHSLIIALGGGVVGDLAGFVAATFLRGVDYIQIPTTILAHDSSVGGKVAINHELGKNLIGCFYPPQAVVYDVETLISLSKHEVRSGYAELVKEALISDADFFDDLIQNQLTDLSNQQLKEHLLQGIKVKADIVEEDEKESGVRMYLNLGHTLGHAIEAELGYGKLTHGEAIAIGLLFAIRVSEQRYGIHLPYDPLYQWLNLNEYPLSLQQLKADHLINRMKSDKKVVNKKIKMVLLTAIGEPKAEEIDDNDLLTYLENFMEELVTK